MNDQPSHNPSVNPSQPFSREGVPEHNEKLSGALAAWREAIGEEGVRTSQQILQRYARSARAAGALPAAVLYPRTTEHVRRIVRIAAQTGGPRAGGVGLHPVSTGKNWGYGDANAPRAGQVIVDLSGMNRIVEVNEELAYAVIEPGVTQLQLWQYLEQHHTGLWMDSSGAGEDVSIVGNTLERGFGHTRYGNHLQAVSSMQIVLGNGEVIDTGFGALDAEAKARWVYAYGVGPSLNGLFTQSHFGIVTRMGVWLAPRPEAFCAFFFSAPDPADLPELVQRLGPLKRQGLLPSAIHIGNDLRMLSSRMRYPWDRVEGGEGGALSEELRRALRKEHGIGAWAGSGALHGTREMVAAARKAVRRALGPYKPIFVDDKRLRRVKRLSRVLGAAGLKKAQRGLGEKIDLIEPNYQLLKGRPTNQPLRGTGWRVREQAPPPATDPLQTPAGLMWIAPILPMTGAAAREVIALMEPIYTRHGFDMLATFTMINDRALVCVSNISFDKRDAKETARAQACHEELMDRLTKAGYYPYRTGPREAAQLTQGPSTLRDMIARLKQAMDPENLISPGRYRGGEG